MVLVGACPFLWAGAEAESWWLVLQGRGKFPCLPSALVIKLQPSGSLWALVSPFSSWPAHRAVPHTSCPRPTPSLPPATRLLEARCHSGHSGHSTLHLPVRWCLHHCSVPCPETFLTPLLAQLLESLLQKDQPLLPRLSQSPCTGTFTCVFSG